MLAEVVGHDRVRERLQRAVEQRRVPPALLLTGPAGVGKHTLALALARALLCSREGRCGGDCPSCVRVLKGGHPDLIRVAPAAGWIKIEQVREAAREIMGRPFEAPARVLVIDDAQLMTEQASNALLKSLEEPPPTSHLLLVTAAPQALLPTIRSRCQVVRLGPLPGGLLEAELRERLGLSGEEARRRATLASGSLGAALALDSDRHQELRERVLLLLERSGDAIDRLSAAEELTAGDVLADALLALRSLLRDLCALRAGADPARLLNADLAERLIPIAEGDLGGRAGSLAEAVGDALERLRGNANRPQVVDDLLGRIAAPRL